MIRALTHRELLIGLALAGLAAFSTLFHPAAPLVLAGAVWFVMLGLGGALPFLLAFLVALLLRPGDFAPELADLQIAKWGAVAALGMMVGGKLLRGDLGWVRAPQNGYLVWLTAAAFIASVRSSDPIHSQAYFQDIFVKILIVYVLILNLGTSPRRALAIQLTLAACTALLGAYAIYLQIVGEAQIEGSRAAFVGLLGDPNDLALTLLIGIPFLVGAGYRDGQIRWGWTLLAALAIGGLLSSQSRGGMLGLGAALYLLLRDRVRSRWLAVGAAAVILGGGLVAAGIGERRTVAGAGLDDSAQGRLDAWMAGARMFRARPVFGIGLETFAANYPGYAINPVEWAPKEAHNSWVKALAEAGIFGFIPFCLLLWVTGVMAWNLRRKTGPPGLPQVQRETLFAAFAGVMVAAFFLSQTWNWFIYILVALVAATTGALNRSELEVDEG